MVSFRYHVVTIVAVFLALGLGILMGTTVIKQSVVDELRARADSAVSSSEQLRTDVSELRRQLRTWDAFAPQAQHVMVQGALTGRTAVVVTADGVDIGEIDGVRRAIVDAGATVSGVLVISARMRLADDESTRRLAGVLGLPEATDPAELARRAADLIGLRLAQGAPGGEAAVDLLDSLAGARLLSVREPANGVRNIGGPGQSIVLLTGGPGEPAADPQAFFVPLLESLVQAGQAVAAGETTQTATDVLGLIRADGALNQGLVTVDNADEMIGRVALVLGIRDLLGGGVTDCADFGLRSDACGLIPVPTPSP